MRFGTCPKEFGLAAGGGFGPTVCAVVVGNWTTGFTTVVFTAGAASVAAAAAVAGGLVVKVARPTTPVPARVAGAGTDGKFDDAARSARALAAATALVSSEFVCARASHNASAAATISKIGFINLLLRGL